MAHEFLHARMFRSENERRQHLDRWIHDYLDHAAIGGHPHHASRIVFNGMPGFIQIWDPARPDDGPLSIPLEGFDPEGQSDDPPVARSLGALANGGIMVASTRDETLVVEEINPASGVSERGGFYRENVPPSPTVIVVGDSTVAIGGTNGQVNVDLVGDDGVRINTGHSGTVIAIARLPDGQFVTGSDDGTVRIWSVETGTAVDTLPVFTGHTDAVLSIATLDDGRVVSGSADGAVLVWDPDDPSRVRGA